MFSPLTNFEHSDHRPIGQFKYDNLSRVSEWRNDNNKRPSNDLYFAHDYVDGYIHVYKKKQLYDRYDEQEGWKIHVSINTNISGNLGKAWDIIMPILMRYGVYHYKLLAPPLCIPNELKCQPGKEIVIYEFDSRENMPWEAILKEIHQQLKINEIIPGSIPRIRCRVNNNSNKKIIISAEDQGDKGIEYKISEYLYVTNDSRNKDDIMQNSGMQNDGPFKDINFLSSSLTLFHPHASPSIS